MSRATLAANYGELLRGEGRTREAEDPLHDGLALVRAMGDPVGMATVYLLNSLAPMAVDHGRYEQASGLLATALQVMGYPCGRATARS